MKIVIIVLILAIIGSFIYQQGCFRIDNERAGVIFLRGGYRAYWVRYSEGMMWANSDSKHKREVFYRINEDGFLEKVTRGYDFEPKNMWCFPRFEHADARELLEREAL